mmetsp:Transcript_24085/g.53562  ORF Transcript_24085/g.53562 Transcript_24085/m.53562 type:complete len:212 (+) Transcript_24085:899-1534(+)
MLRLLRPIMVARRLPKSMRARSASCTSASGMISRDSPGTGSSLSRYGPPPPEATCAGDEIPFFSRVMMTRSMCSSFPSISCMERATTGLVSPGTAAMLLLMSAILADIALTAACALALCTAAELVCSPGGGEPVGAAASDPAAPFSPVEAALPPLRRFSLSASLAFLLSRSASIALSAAACSFSKLERMRAFSALSSSPSGSVCFFNISSF